MTNLTMAMYHTFVRNLNWQLHHTLDTVEFNRAIELIKQFPSYPDFAKLGIVFTNEFTQNGQPAALIDTWPDFSNIKSICVQHAVVMKLNQDIPMFSVVGWTK